MKHPFDLWAYVLMPEHVHLLILPHEGTRISAILQAVKQPVAQRAGARARNTGEAHRFWQAGGGYDRNMRTVREVHEKFSYIHENPVLRGLVERPEGWPWSSARTWVTGEVGPITIDRENCPVLELTRRSEW